MFDLPKLSDWPDASAPYSEHYNFALYYYNESCEEIPLKYKRMIVDVAPTCEVCQMVKDPDLETIGMGGVVCKCGSKHFTPDKEKKHITIWTTQEEIDADDGKDEERESEEKLRSVDEWRHWFWHKEYRQY